MSKSHCVRLRERDWKRAVADFVADYLGVKAPYSFEVRIDDVRDFTSGEVERVALVDIGLPPFAKPESEWSKFLAARAKLIREHRADGKSFGDIAELLSCGAEQVLNIARATSSAVPDSSTDKKGSQP